MKTRRACRVVHATCGRNMLYARGLVRTILLIAVGIGLLAYFRVDVRTFVGGTIRWIGEVVG